MKAKFTDIDLPLQQQFQKQFFYSAGILLLAVFWFVTTKDLFSSLLIIFFALMFAVFTLYRVFNCLEDNVVIFKGTCVDIYIPKKKKPSYFFTHFYERAYITVKTDNDIFIEIYIPQNFKCKLQNHVTAYAPPSYLFAKNSNTFSLSSFYYLYVDKT